MNSIISKYYHIIFKMHQTNKFTDPNSPFVVSTLKNFFTISYLHDHS